MPARGRRTRRVKRTGRPKAARPRRRRVGQKGGLFPLAALIPALVAGAKAAALGGISGGVGYGVKRALGGR